MKYDYTLEASIDGCKWIFQTGFNDGEASRFGKNFNMEAAVAEAKSFKEYRGRVYPHIRLIINI